MSIHGGEIWKQNRFPFMRCYLVFLGDSWCRIQPPDQRGNIAWTADDGDGGWKWQYTKDEMEQMLTDMDYECLGQFSEILREQKESLYAYAVTNPDFR